ncbi:hypothetical protein [Ralstonia mannitolilytica]|uniref:hypothetical protein n=1 Tax=Ralstonia mannitolilytica TaxID=105219 RepID=UPI0013DE05BD|nr:hypothetical protein G5A69_05620 [Ralstonia mannitolilytica]
MSLKGVRLGLSKFGAKNALPYKKRYSSKFPPFLSIFLLTDHAFYAPFFRHVAARQHIGIAAKPFNSARHAVIKAIRAPYSG